MLEQWRKYRSAHEGRIDCDELPKMSWLIVSKQRNFLPKKSLHTWTAKFGSAASNGIKKQTLFPTEPFRQISRLTVQNRVAQYKSVAKKFLKLWARFSLGLGLFSSNPCAVVAAFQPRSHRQNNKCPPLGDFHHLKGWSYLQILASSGPLRFCQKQQQV